MSHASRLSCLLACAVLTCFTLMPIRSAAYPPDADGEARKLQRDGKPAEAAAVYERLIAANPYAPSLYGGYGHCRYALKRYDDAIAAFERAIALGGSPAGNLYNIVCCHALAGRNDEALKWLAKAYDAGFVEQETIEKDTDIDPLRGDARFVRLTGLNPPPGASRDERWRYDLDFVARRMKQMHWDLYGKISEQEFLGEIARLKADVPKLKDHQVLLRLRRIVASVGDGHSGVPIRKPGAAESDRAIPYLPVGFYQFADGLHVRWAASGHEKLLGARVVKIGALDAAAAFDAAKAYCAVDNDMGYLDGVPPLLAMPWVLEAIGATADTSGATLTVRDRDGKESTVRLDAVQVEPEQRMKHLRPLHETLGDQPPRPLYLKDVTRPLWREHLPDRKLLYVYFGGVEDPEGSTFEQFWRETFDFVERSGVEYLVLDMRLNGGGNTGLVMPLIHGLLKCERVNQPGKLFVVIGRRTFSAAQNTATLIEMHTHATFVGEPTGSSPNFVGESTYLALPYHKNRVYCSSRYWQFMTSTDRRTWIAPQIAAPLTSADYARNHDPVMAAITKAIDEGWARPTTAPTTNPATAPAAAVDAR